MCPSGARFHTFALLPIASLDLPLHRLDAVTGDLCGEIHQYVARGLDSLHGRDNPEFMRDSPVRATCVRHRADGTQR